MSSKTALEVPERLLSDLHTLTRSSLEAEDLSRVPVKTPEGALLLAQCLRGVPLAHAIAESCEAPNSTLRLLLFGGANVSPLLGAHGIEGRRGDHLLYLLLSTRLDEEFPAELCTNYTSVALRTDFKTFVLFRFDVTSRYWRPFKSLSLGEVSEDVAFSGSLWDLAHPEHFGIVSRTISCTFPNEGGVPFFSAGLDPSDELNQERLAVQHLQCLAGEEARVMSLDAYREALCVTTRQPSVDATDREGTYTLRRYSPRRSSIFDFGSPPRTFSRGDSVTTYNAENEEFHREYVVVPRELTLVHEECLLAGFDLLHMLGIRRGKLFRVGFASRVYNVLLPPVLATAGCNSVAIYTLLHLYRTPLKGFRRTVGISTIAIPISVTVDKATPVAVGSRRATLDELYALKDDLVAYPPTASAKPRLRYSVWAPPPLRSPRQPQTLPDLVQNIASDSLKRMLDGSCGDTDDVVRTCLLTANHEARIATMSLQVDWTPPSGATQPWERWVATGEDRVFLDALYRTMFFRDYSEPYAADTSRSTVRFADFNIGNTLGADMGGMTLYNPQETLKFVLYPLCREKYPDYSIVRWMTWQLYIDSALTSLRALIYRFNPLLEERGDLHSIIHTLDEMIDEFVDFYDLDIRDHFYRVEYAKLRSLMQVDSDYAQLLAKFESSKEDESLREQRLINKLIVSLTIATVTVSVVSTVAQEGALSIGQYLLAATTISTVMVWLGYVTFDPCRRALSQGRQRLRAMLAVLGKKDWR